MTTTHSPRARSRPAVMAKCCPKLRERLTPLMRESAPASSRMTSQEPWGQPSFTRMISHSATRDESVVARRSQSVGRQSPHLNTGLTTERMGVVSGMAKKRRDQGGAFSPGYRNSLERAKG